MGLFSTLSVGVNALQSQDNKINVISDNITNANTAGYKRVNAEFITLVNQYSAPSTYSAAGVKGTTRQSLRAQGEISPADNVTNLAIGGPGFFAVTNPNMVDSSGATLFYTRAGAFEQDKNGDFVNTAGFFLQGWQLDENGELPEGLDSTAVAGGAGIAALQNINIRELTSSPVPTSTVFMQANLNSSQAVFTPATDYDPTDSARNMASGAVQSHYNRPFTVVDGAGNERELVLAFLKTDINTWSVEIYSDPADNVTTQDGIIASGTVVFNGDGSLNSISPSLQGPITADWDNTGGPVDITFDLGTAGPIFGTPGAVIVGRTDGLSQLNDDYVTRQITQNGSLAGNLASIDIDREGYVIGTYDNDTSKRLFKIPLANFNDPNALQPLTGNIFIPTTQSGQVFFLQANEDGVGNIQSSSLESSNVDIATELTNIIVAQQAYQANTRLINTTDAILQDLTDMLR